MQALQVINLPGPLPLKAQFNAPLDGPALLVVTGSLWSTVANTMLQLSVALDGTVIAIGQLWSNGPNTHRVLPAIFINCNLTDGQHTLTLSGGQNVISDLNDTFTASILY